MTEKIVKIVKKGTKEFAEAKLKFHKLFSTEEPEETVQPGKIGMKTTQLDKLQELPLPFSCLDLELYVWHKDETKDGLNHVAYFCSKLGCLCMCAREDAKETYPDACPDVDEMFWDSYDEHEDYDPGYDEDFFDEDDW